VDGGRDGCENKQEDLEKQTPKTAKRNNEQPKPRQRSNDGGKKINKEERNNGGEGSNTCEQYRAEGEGFKYSGAAVRG
jgi:hypothetical protein